MIASPNRSGVPAERIRKLFGQWLKSGHCTGLFDDFPVDLREQLVRIAGVEPEEQPLVACYFNPEAWALLTDRRLIWLKAGCTSALPWDALLELQVTQRSGTAPAPGEKAAVSYVQLVTREGHVHDLAWEAGPPFLAFWTTLKMITRAQRHG